MQTFELRTSSDFATSRDFGMDVTRLWLAPGLARIGAVFGDSIFYNQVVLCWDTVAQHMSWEAAIYDDDETYPDPDFDRELARVVYLVSPSWEVPQPSHFRVRELANGVETRLGGRSAHFAAITLDGREVFARTWSESNQALHLLRWRIPTELGGAGDLTPDKRWSIDLPRRNVDQMMTVLAISPDGKRLAVGRRDGAVIVSSAAGPREIARVPGIKKTKYRSYSAQRLSFSPDGSRLAVVRDNPRKKQAFVVSVWTVPGGKQEKGPSEKASVNGIAFSPDGHTLLAAREDGRIGVWDTATWKLRHEYAWKIGKLFSVAFAPDGLTCAAGGENGQVVVWDVE